MTSPTVQCLELTKSFGGVKAVDRLSVSFEPGRVTALVGPNGAGKTTLFHLISGSLRPDAGEIQYCSRRIDRLKPWQIARIGVGRLFQDVRVFNKISVLDNVRVAFSRQQGENPLWALIARHRVNQQEVDLLVEARKWLEFVGLGGLENVTAESLSYGQQKLLAVARLLAAGADVFLLDEPTAGVNQVMVRSLLTLVQELAAEGKTIVIIEHNMNVVAEVADWVFFMDEGRIVAFGQPEEVLADPEIRLTYLGF
jgi:ABC-type branched-subunit amino acid transport system ATPase component